MPRLLFVVLEDDPRHETEEGELIGFIAAGYLESLSCWYRPLRYWERGRPARPATRNLLLLIVVLQAHLQAGRNSFPSRHAQLLGRKVR